LDDKGEMNMTRTEKEKMLAGDLYDAGAPELQAEMAAAHEWLARYNAALGRPPSEIRELLLERLAAAGEGAVIRPPFHCDYGFNISLGAGVFLNFNCVILDVVEVTIGDRRRSAQGFRFLRPITHATQLGGPRGWSLVAQST
jgi:maltose O-acetyltransferase